MTHSYRRFKQVERIVRPRMTPGVDFGADRVVLVRDGDKELWWRLSHKTWMGLIFGYQHTGATLELVSDAYLGYPNLKELHEGGRLSRKLLTQYADKINKFFGCQVAQAIDPKKTLVADDKGFVHVPGLAEG
jgi:hypothetical protein